ncbi:hypothetical protein FOC1_g10001373, partial [Fusarium oxysporum f. sp. cubense race 1]
EAGRCKPRIYITYVRKVVERENPGLEPLEQVELQNTFLLQTFRGYLKGHALQLFEEERLGDKTLKDIIPLFEEKFSKPKNFYRMHRQTYHRIPPNFRQTVLTCFVLHMNDGNKKKCLQERVQNRLCTTAKWDNIS